MCAVLGQRGTARTILRVIMAMGGGWTTDTLGRQRPRFESEQGGCSLKKEGSRARATTLGVEGRELEFAG